MAEELQRKIKVLERALELAVNQLNCQCCPLKRRCENNYAYEGVMCDKRLAHYIKIAEEEINED